ncbi:MAG: hypothetical protein ACI8RD_013848 [Bacillariaceae sp.]|jgi:hypothetical protein
MMMIQRYALLCSLLLVSTVSAMKDAATGIPFDSKSNELSLFGVGVRRKGPIKVYSVGMYCSDNVQEDLSTISRSDSKGKKAIAALRNGASTNPTTFVLKMNFKVGAEKMASAIADSISPRHSSDSEVSQLKDLIFEGVSGKGAAVKGTVLEFDCTDGDEGGVEVKVDGKGYGKVPSDALGKAFRDVYLDDKCVSPKLRENILENCCAP